MKVHRTHTQSAALSLLLLAGAAGLNAAEVNFAEDFSSGTIPAERFEIDKSGESDITVVDGKARLTAVAPEGAAVNTRLLLLGETDYFEAEVVLSSESVTSGTGRSRVQMAGILYNDSAESGVDGHTGDVWAGISLGKDVDDSLWIFACLERSDDADFGATSALLLNENGNECVHLAPPLVPEMDKAYKVSIELDREAGKVSFTFDSETREYIINTPIFKSANESKEVRARREEGAGTTVVFVDNVRTSETAAFGEQNNGGSGTDNGSTSTPESNENSGSDGGSGGGGALAWLLLPILGVLWSRRLTLRASFLRRFNTEQARL
ncbi:MAG: hypothetical protein KDJ38_10095 [Gammaproteobacteria bacterium]|nr:hypothetical protein [Gammaproteobacteria bacterium]